MDFFISDLHFGHKNVIRTCNRPFVTVSEMNDEIIHRWNKKVTDADRVFVLGDVFLCKPEEAKQYITQLNGHKIIIKGNHDFNEKKMLWMGFDEFYKSYDYTMPDGRIALLRHYPYPECLIDDKYDLMMHGHIHISDRVIGRKINVSCDIWDYSPVSIDIINNLRLKELKEDEFFNSSISDDGILTINGSIRMEDLSGAVEFMFKQMSNKWPDRRRK